MPQDSQDPFAQIGDTATATATAAPPAEDPFAQVGDTTKSDPFSAVGDTAPARQQVPDARGPMDVLRETQARDVQNIQEIEALRRRTDITPAQRKRLNALAVEAYRGMAQDYSVADQPEPAWRQAGEQGASAAAGIVSGVLGTIGKVGSLMGGGLVPGLAESAPMLAGVGQRLRQFAETVEPGAVSGAAPGATAARVLGETAGQLAAFTPVQSAISPVVKGLGEATGALFPRATARALSVIADAADAATKVAGPVAGRTVASLPREAAASVAGFAAVDPKSMASWEGWAQAGAFGLLGAFTGSVHGRAIERIAARQAARRAGAFGEAAPAPAPSPPGSPPRGAEPAPPPIGPAAGVEPSPGVEGGPATGEPSPAGGVGWGSQPGPEESVDLREAREVATEQSVNPEPTAGPAPLPVSVKDVISMSPAEVEAAAKRLRVEERATYRQILGVKTARVYKRAQRIATSAESLPEQANAALTLIDKIESRLNPEELTALRSIGKRDITAARLASVARKARDYSPVVLTKVTTPDLVNQFAELVANGETTKRLSQTYALGQVFSELLDRGVDPKTDLLPAAVRYVAAREKIKPNEAAGRVAENIVRIQRLVEPDRSPVVPPTPEPLREDMTPPSGESPPAVKLPVSPADVVIEGQAQHYGPLDPLEMHENLDALSPAEAAIQKQIVVAPEMPTVKDDGASTLTKLYQWTQRGIFGIERATKRLGGEHVPTYRNPGKLAQLAAGSAGREEEMLVGRPFVLDETGSKIEWSDAPGLKQVLAPLWGKLNRFRRLVVARKVLELAQSERQIITGISPADAAQVIATERDPAVIRAADQSVQFLNAVLEYGRRGGLVSGSQMDVMQFLGQSYVPFQRLMEKPSERMTKRLTAARERYIGLKQPGALQRLVGARTRLFDPIAAMVSYTRQMVRAADLNRVRLALTDLALANPEVARGMLERVKDVDVDAAPYISESARNLISNARAMGVEISPKAALETVVTFHDASMKMSSDIMPVWRDGKLEMWRVKDPLLVDSIRSLSPQEMHFIVQMLGAPAQTLKVGVTNNPIFGSIQAFVAMWHGQMQSQYGYRPTDSLVGLWNRIRDTKWRHEFRAGGTSFAGLSAQSVRSVKSGVRSVIPMSTAQRTIVTMIHPLEAMRRITAPLEEAARLGAYIRARTHGVGALDSAIEGRNLDTDFSLRGSSPVWAGLAHATAFLNPFQQSMEVLARSAADHPLKFSVVGLASVGIPSMYFWLASEQDPEVREMQTSQGGFFNWYVRIHGQIYVIKKPYIYGQVFGNTVEAALAEMKDKDPEALSRLGQAVWENTTFNMLPNALQDYIAIRFNKQALSGTPIVPERLLNADAQVQSTPYTSAFSQKVADTMYKLKPGMAVSPAVLDYSIRQLFGTFGQEGLKLADKVTGWGKDKPASVNADLPLIGRFFARYPNLNTGSVREFYKYAQRTQQAVLTVAEYNRDLNPEMYERAVLNNAQWLGLAPVYGETRAQIAKIRADVEVITAAPGLSPETKRELINGQLEQIIQLAKATNLATRDLRP